ncbi:MAG: PAS domain S-box protein [Spirochaetes bacterium]|nr:PAS domain S-box protein [Spirochaetota bacterium]
MDSDKIFHHLPIHIEDILDGISDGIFILNEQGRFLYVNKIIEERSGITFEQFQNLHFLDLIPAKYHQRAKEYFDCLLKGEKLPIEEFEYLTADGLARPVEIRGRTFPTPEGSLLIIVTARNISDRKEAQKALLESLHEKIALYEAIDDGVIIFNANGTVRDINKRFEELCGLSREKIIGIKGELLAKQVVHPKDVGLVLSYFQRALRGERIPPLRFSFQHPVKGNIPCYFTTALHYSDDNSLKAIISVIKDISELESLQQQLLHAEKMKAIGTLAGGIAHDFNNILMGIQGNISLMLLDVPKDNPVREMAENIQQLVQQATALTRQLLGLAKGGKFEPKIENLNEIINNAIHIFGRTHKEIIIKKNFSDHLWAVKVDKGQIDQVLLNILVNAWQAMPSGGTITIETDNVEISDFFSPAGIGPGKYVKISISDTGIGMNDAVRQRIFDPFFTTKEMGKGVGLGLTSAYAIIKQHRGFIEVESEVGQGSTFTIYLPAAEATAPQSAPHNFDITTGEGTILVVDDEPHVLDVTAKILEKLGYRTYKAQTKEEAIYLIQTKTIHLDCIILDMIMPGTNPVEIMDQIKKYRNNIPVILASGYSMEEKINEVQSMGYTDFLQKPFKIEELSFSIHHALHTTKKN